MTNSAFHLAAALALGLFGCTPPPLTETHLVGTWKVDAGLAPAGRSWPSNTSEFRLTLNSNATFIARNIPDDFFFSYTHTPAASEHSGTWDLRLETDESYHLNLRFLTRGGHYGTILKWKRGRLVIDVSKQHEPATTRSRQQRSQDVQSSRPRRDLSTRFSQLTLTTKAQAAPERTETSLGYLDPHQKLSDSY